NLLTNPQDKFIIYGLFNGISGKENQHLSNLKAKDIDLENGKIYIPDRVVAMDEYMKDICVDMLDPVFGATYYRYIDDKKNNLCPDNYELNFKSEYAIKSRPTNMNSDGLEPMKKEGIKTRLHKLSKVTGMSLSSKDLVRSGVMHKMNKIKKTGWTVVEIKEFLNQNNFKMQPFALQKLYDLKYGN
ncbi:MAG TPA: hypothetical protein VLM92_15665, partial [Romboutsia sp.]|nr:hypothetical protein [Romboutsia sp.]